MRSQSWDPWLKNRHTYLTAAHFTPGRMDHLSRARKLQPRVSSVSGTCVLQLQAGISHMEFGYAALITLADSAVVSGTGTGTGRVGYRIRRRRRHGWDWKEGRNMRQSTAVCRGLRWGRARCWTCSSAGPPSWPPLGPRALGSRGSGVWLPWRISRQTN